MEEEGLKKDRGVDEEEEAISPPTISTGASASGGEEAYPPSSLYSPRVPSSAQEDKDGAATIFCCRKTTLVHPLMILVNFIFSGQ